MPRTARQKGDSKIYHVLVPGINRQTIFEDEEDASKYLHTLKGYEECCIKSVNDPVLLMVTTRTVPVVAKKRCPSIRGKRLS